MDIRRCSECPAPIHSERLNARPNTVTCSATSTWQRQKRLRLEAAVRSNQRRREKAAKITD